jgi:transforming growth factor-beta-induced protein
MKKQLLSIKQSLLAATIVMSSGISFAQTTVYDVIAGSTNHTYLKAALDQEGLNTVLDVNANQYTVFAPDNAAFEQLILDLNLTGINDVLALADLSNILQYHVLSGSVPSSAVSNGQIVNPLHNDNTLKLTTDGASVFANQAEVNGADLMGSNGYVHSINSVLLDSETVADIAIDSPNHITLVAAVVEARLLPALTNPFSELTVFAPTDAAFTVALTAMNITSSDLLASPDLADILLYHVLGAELLSTDLSNGLIAQPLSVTNTLKVTISGADVFVNQAQVTAANVQAGNGAVHVLDGVMLPGETVADIAIDSPDHTTLVAAVVEARLLPALTDPFSKLTVFAPTDVAFTAALAAMNISAADLLASPDLGYILLYHVIGSEALSSSLTNGPVTTLNGQDVIVDISTSVMINDANVTNADITSSNGVVHIMDGVLLPNLTSIEENNNLDVIVYPNPAVNVLNITLNSNELFDLTITDLNGKQILAERISNTSNMVDISNLSSGMYLMRIANSNVQSTTKIQINK